MIRSLRVRAKACVAIRVVRFVWEYQKRKILNPKKNLEKNKKKLVQKLNIQLEK